MQQPIDSVIVDDILSDLSEVSLLIYHVFLPRIEWDERRAASRGTVPVPVGRVLNESRTLPLFYIYCLQSYYTSSSLLLYFLSIFNDLYIWEYTKYSKLNFIKWWYNIWFIRFLNLRYVYIIMASFHGKVIHLHKSNKNCASSSIYIYRQNVYKDPRNGIGPGRDRV